MRVKLSYTVEEEDVLEEAANLIGLSSPRLQSLIDLFNMVQGDLRAEGTPDKIVNVPRVLESIEKLREALLTIDLRVSEVSEIIKGYDSHPDDSEGAV